MKKIISSPQNHGLKQIFRLAFLFWLIEILLITLTWSSLPPQVPLFYSRPWGAEQLVHPAVLFLLPGLGFLAFLLNLIILSFLPKEEKLLPQILISFLLVFNFLSLIALSQIIRLVL